jgi:hypothetical protein
VRYKCILFGELTLDEAMGLNKPSVLTVRQTDNNDDACHLLVWPEQYLCQTFLEEISQKNNLESGIRGKYERGFNKIDHGNVNGSKLDPVMDKQQKETRLYVVLFYICKYCLERFGSTKKQKLSLV